MEQLGTKDALRVMFIYKALEKGWTVKKGKEINSFEFIRSRNNSSEFNNSDFDLQLKTRRRSISEPITYC